MDFKSPSRFRWLILAALAVLLVGQLASRSGNHGLAGTLSLFASLLFGAALAISLRGRYRRTSGSEEPTSEPIQGPTSSGHEFLADLRTAARSWRASPRLVAVTVVISVAGIVGNSSQVDPLVSICSVLVTFLSAGFYGTQRVWYLRTFRGLSISPREVWAFSWAFFGRYVVLGLLAAIPLVPLITIASLTVDRRAAYFGGPWYAVIIIFTVVVDLLLTFVTPELAFRTRSAVQALDTGIRMIRRTWPAGAYYVFLPPLAIQVLLFQLSGVRGTSLLGIGVAAAVAALISLLFKGAIAAFYLRHVPGIGDDGAAYLAHPTKAASARLGETESAT